VTPSLPSQLHPHRQNTPPSPHNCSLAPTHNFVVTCSTSLTHSQC
jgi:hypothetical protein